MEQRLANSGKVSVNEKNFIQSALLSGLRVDGRDVYDYRKITINFGRDDGSAEVRLGQTRVMGVVTSQLVQPYRDRPNEGTLSIFTEFSPMADHLFEPGRPGESAVELGRVIDRGLRESRAVDTESLCVLAGKLVWAIRVDLHILDNGGNLVDAANIAALAALSTFRRPECSLGGEDGQEVIVHPPEAREPLPLIIHHLPVAVTFGFFSNEGIVVVDPTHQEENVMTGRMTATLNKNGDVCAIQKAGGEGVSQSIIMHCLRVATTKAADITSKIKDAVETCNRERALRKIKRHSAPIAMDVSGAVADVKEKQRKPDQDSSALSGDSTARSKSKSEQDQTDQGNDDEGKVESKLFKQQGETNIRAGQTKNFIGRPLCWDPYSKSIDLELLRSSLASRVTLTPGKKQKDFGSNKQHNEAKLEALPEKLDGDASPVQSAKSGGESTGAKTLKDAVKPKNKRKKKASSASDGS